MFFVYTEKSKDEDEHKNIIDTQAPFHQITAEIFECEVLPIFDPYKSKMKTMARATQNKVCHNACRILIELIFLLRSPRSNAIAINEYNAKNKISDLFRCH